MNLFLLFLQNEVIMLIDISIVLFDFHLNLMQHTLATFPKKEREKLAYSLN